ncbi:DNA replication complex GINS PSF2 [Micractinium conductrix]|uniref:DNA replication complex GINS PSF2 n=1 Tax=Micractinium conductrix TaxID=554055 RepID=A0A2P6VB92_9CHLO|nr:DNA replication complex GINS PSF2 [Micractinium conductrix]|eukprot:PSC71362.1 DNA replication complex GINS PSF2 [Micractinium conductrix]
MAYSRQAQWPCTPEEMYFNAKNEMITIVPNFSIPTENASATCIGGEWGPFQPNRETQVPLWLAHTLWKRKRCAIKAPAWMNAEHLDAVLGLERQDASAFQPLPFHYIEVAYFLFTSGTDGNLPQEVFGDDLARVKDLVELVQKARMAKILAGLATLQGAITVKLNNLAALEINAVRPFFLGALDMFFKYQGMEEGAIGGSQVGGSLAPSTQPGGAPRARQLRVEGGRAR